MGARIRLPLRVLLPCVAVCLAASGAAAIGAVCVRAAGSYVIRQADDGLRACASGTLSHGAVAVPGSGAVAVPGSGAGQASPVPCDMELLSVSGQVLIPAPAGAGEPGHPGQRVVARGAPGRAGHRAGLREQRALAGGHQGCSLPGAAHAVRVRAR